MDFWSCRAGKVKVKGGKLSCSQSNQPLPSCLLSCILMSAVFQSQKKFSSSNKFSHVHEHFSWFTSKVKLKNKKKALLASSSWENQTFWSTLYHKPLKVRTLPFCPSLFTSSLLNPPPKQNAYMSMAFTKLFKVFVGFSPRGRHHPPPNSPTLLLQRSVGASNPIIRGTEPNLEAFKVNYCWWLKSG